MDKVDEIDEIDKIDESKINKVRTWLLVLFLLMSRVLFII